MEISFEKKDFKFLSKVSISQQLHLLYVHLIIQKRSSFAFILLFIEPHCIGLKKCKTSSKRKNKEEREEEGRSLGSSRTTLLGRVVGSGHARIRRRRHAPSFSPSILLPALDRSRERDATAVCVMMITAERAHCRWRESRSHTRRRSDWGGGGERSMY